MRKRMMASTTWGAALTVLALVGGMTVAMPGGAAGQTTERAWLGVTTQEITTDLREGLDYRGSGVLVNSVVPDSPADRAGMEQGDVLVSFNSRTIDTPSELVDVVRTARVGQSVSLVVIRDGQRRSLTARLTSRNDSDMGYDDTPTPTAPRAPRVQRAPRAPEAPSAPRARTFTWDGDSFDMPGMRGFTNLNVFGRGRLGVQIQDLNEDMAEALGVTGGKGVLVTDVNEDTPAAKAGIKGGDVIVEVGGTRVDDIEDLRRELGEHEGRTSITLMRRGARRTVEPVLEDKRQITRWRSDDGDREVIRIPDVRRRVERDARDERLRSRNNTNNDDLEKQMEQLREELREMRRQMEADRKP